jgi:hypothetical protein
MVTMGFTVDEKHLPAIQVVVKRYDLRFRNNPAAFVGMGSAHVEINDNDQGVEAWHAAMAEIDAIRCPPAATARRNWFQRLLDRLLGGRA